jgi:hypothetical protein
MAHREGRPEVAQSHYNGAVAKEETMRLSRWLAIALVVLSVGTLAAQAKPNFSGEWKLAPAKSDFGMMPAPSSGVQKITHNEPQLKVVNTQTSDQGTNTTESSYTTDGKVCVNPGRMGDTKSTLKWDGSALVTETKMDFQGTEVTITNRWVLSDDGKTLTVNMHFSTPMGEGDAKMVYEKQ